MKIYAVDDEELALDMLAAAIREAYPEAFVEAFSNPEECIRRMEEDPCDVLFSDIRMPEMDGMDFAAKCQRLNPKVNIIFVTAYDDYAMEAFRIYASGYVQKPVTAQKIQKEMEHLRFRPDSEVKCCRIQCYGAFEVFDRENRPVHFHRSKSKEIIAYLVHCKGAFCTIRQLAAILFEDAPYDVKQTRYMQKLISTLQSDLEENHMAEVLIRNYNTLAIDVNRVSCDYFDDPNRSKVIENGGEYMSQYSWAEGML